MSSMSKTQNRFTSFQDPEEVQAAAQVQAQQVKKATVQKDAGKKVVIKKAAPVQNTEEFEKVDNKPATAGGRGARGGRGERGGRGGDRGGRGGRGERGGRGGERGGRGGRGERGGRPRTAATGEDGDATVERAERGGYRKKFEGKAREDAHPMDRQDGTGRGRRGDRKDGDRRGGWGGKKPEDGEETKGDAAPVEEEKKERAPRVKREPEPVVEEEEEVGFTLDDYIAEKAAKSKGLMGSGAQVRNHEKIQDKVADRTDEKKNIMTIDRNLTSRDMHAIRPPVNANLLGFQAPVDVEFSEGGRGRGRGDRREPREPRQGGRQQGKRGG